MRKYPNRKAAGKRLASELLDYADSKDTYVLALPRGGVPVAYEIARALHLPLDVWIVRKIGCPFHDELALGALASLNTPYLNDSLIEQLHISKDALQAVIARERAELQRRMLRYRGQTPFPSLKNKKVILVDDGIATGASITAAIHALKKHEPRQVIVAVPVGAADTIHRLEKEVDKVICPLRPNDFYAVGLWYDDFPQTEDDEVITLLHKARHHP